MQHTETSEQQALYTRNTPDYAFVDTDMMILLNALEQKDQKDLDSDTIITMPVSQEDHTLAQKLDKINQLDHKDYLLPIKMTGRFHWQLIKLSQDDGKKRQKKSNINAMIKSSLFVEKLVENGQMVSRMLSD